MTRKSLLIAGLVALMTIAFASAAFAHHSPSFYIAWSSGAPGNSNGPHTDYSLTSTKCAVCHAAHRAPVEGAAYNGTNYGTYSDGFPNAKGVRPAWSTTAADGPTQMLLRSSVANACNYCHITTNVGGVRLYNGNVLNFNGGGWTSGGFAHNTGCTGCHAVHGAKTFKGAAASKILTYASNSSNIAIGLGPEHTYNDPNIGPVPSAIQDEIFLAGGFAVSGGRVATGSAPLFSGNSIANPIEGTNVNYGANTKNAQVSAFCTQCHANYSSASEIVVNIDDEMVLFTGDWNFSGVQALYSATYLYKNHPIKPAETTFTAAGSTYTGQVAWVDAVTCRACHDAGETDSSAGVVENSYPHFTPGYYMFMASAANAGTYGTVNKNIDDYADAAVPGTPSLPLAAPKSYGYADGHCLKCHVNAAGNAGVNLTY